MPQPIYPATQGSGGVHKDLAAGRWFTLSLAEQLGNIGSEVERAIKWQQKREEEQKERALERALELFDLTIKDPRWRKGLRELTRAREVLCDVFYGDNIWAVSFEELKRYFFAFACAARLK